MIGVTINQFTGEISESQYKRTENEVGKGAQPESARSNLGYHKD